MQRRTGTTQTWIEGLSPGDAKIERDQDWLASVQAA
jgi:hypothetical protein